MHTFVEQRRISKQDLKRSEQVTSKVFIDKHFYGKYWALSSDQKSLELDANDRKKFCSLVRLKFITIDENKKGFSNSRQNIIKHCCSLKHKNNVINQFKEDVEIVEFKKYNEDAGVNVFEQLYFGKKEGFSTRIIQENICQLQIKNVEVGTINHSEGIILINQRCPC